MTERKQIVDRNIIKKMTKEESDKRPPFLTVEELPVESFYLSWYFNGQQILKGDEYTMCSHVLKIWKQAGSVLIFDRKCLEDSIQYHALYPSYWSSDVIHKTVDNLIEANYLTDQNGWLVPEKPLLTCATDRENPWGKTYYDIKISLQE